VRHQHGAWAARMRALATAAPAGRACQGAPGRSRAPELSALAALTGLAALAGQARGRLRGIILQPLLEARRPALQQHARSARPRVS